MVIRRIRIRKSCIAKCVCTHKDFVLALRLPVHIQIQQETQ